MTGEKSQAYRKRWERAGVAPFAALSLLLHIAILSTLALLWRGDSPRVTATAPARLIGVTLIASTGKAEEEGTKASKEAKRPNDAPKALKRTAAHNKTAGEGKTHAAPSTAKPAEASGLEGGVEGALSPPGGSSGKVVDVAYPDYRLNPKPSYPQVAKRRGYEGTVLLKVLVSRAGKAEVVEVERSSGYGVLDEAALRAVRQWLFVPAKVGGEPTDSWVMVPVTFKLSGG
jgi:TonB family protein